MLFIWDIHSTRKYIHPCIDAIQQFVEHNDHDNSIVFVWDYVYHFNYDRVALHTLFSYRIELVQQWKKIFILAWNHDWIHNQFVFAEWKLAFETLPWLWDGSIEFITEPALHSIEWRDVLFFPYTTTFPVDTIRDEYKELSESTHAKERLSAQANSVFHDIIDTWKKDKIWSEKLLIVHHRYLANVAFPWQFAKFGYGSPALSSHRLDDEKIMMISWHLHQPFLERNYCCIGSVWSTSPLEINQQKYLFKLHDDARSFTASPVSINPFYQADVNELEWWIDMIVQNIQWKSRDHLQSPLRSMRYDDALGDSWYENTTLTVVSDTPWSLDGLPDDIKQRVWTLRQKQSSQTLGTLITSMQESSKELDKSFSDRKTLLQEFLSAKYGDRKEPYVQDLEQLWVL